MAVAEPSRCPSCSGIVGKDARFCGGCGAPIGDADPSGRVVADRYRIAAKLGEGGMGTVFRAEQISLKRQVALKVLKAELSREQGLVRRFNAEAELAARLNHPNTVTLFDFGQDHDGSLFIAMELVPGRSLRHVLGKEGALSVDRALFITEQVCASLGDAHAHGIVHRDLKPDNVMLTSRGKQEDIVRVLDFGIAKVRDGGVTQNPMTQAGDLLGTPQYMAPEQIRGEPVDGRADVYAVGCMLFEMVTGKLPFRGSSFMAILGKHLTDAPEAPSSVRPDLGIPPEIDRLVLECLNKAPADRPRSMEALGETITGLRRRMGIPTPNAHSTFAGNAPTALAPPVPTPGFAASAPSNAGAAPAAPTPAPISTQPTPAPGSIKMSWVWIALAALVLGGAGVTSYLLLQRSRGDEASAPTREVEGETFEAPAGFDTQPVRDILGDGEDEAPPSEPPAEVPSDFDTQPVRPIL